MSTSIRLKVQIGTEDNNNRNSIPILKFIYIIDSPYQKTVDDLRQNLQTFVNEHYSHTNIEILQLTTIDGFQFNKTDRCSDAFQNNDHILCIDMKAFVLEVYPTIDFDSAWLLMDQHDPSDNREKSIRIGLNNLAQLYVRLWVDSNMNSIYLFSYFDLTNIKQTKSLIGRFEGTSELDANWFLEAKWEHEKELFILCNIKIGTEEKIYSNKLQIQLNQKQKQIEQGEVIALSDESNDQSALVDQQRQRLKELVSNLPPPKRSGPQISLSQNENFKLTKYECEGESSIRMTVGNTNTIVIFQNHRQSSEDFFRQYFTITHIIFSKKPQILPEILQQKRSQPADKPVSVVSLAVLYQTQDGAWRESQDVAVAPAAIRNEEPKWLTDSIIHIEPDKLVSFTIKGWIPVKGECGQNAQSLLRSHKTLPQPLKLKIVITDNFNRQCSLIVEQSNPPLNLLTRESFIKNNQSTVKELLAFVSVDDCERDERYAAIMYLNNENELVIKNTNISSQSLRRKALRTMEFNARKAQTTELPFEYLTNKYNANECTITGLFDPESYLLYAIRFQLSTRTSKTEEVHAVPIEKIQD